MQLNETLELVGWLRLVLDWTLVINIETLKLASFCYY